MSVSSIPVEVEDITVAWLEDVLRRRAPGASLHAVAVCGSIGREAHGTSGASTSGISSPNRASGAIA